MVTSWKCVVMITQCKEFRTWKCINCSKNQQENNSGHLTTHAENASVFKGSNNYSVMLWLYVSNNKLEVNAQKKWGYTSLILLLEHDKAWYSSTNTGVRWPGDKLWLIYDWSC